MKKKKNEDCNEDCNEDFNEDCNEDCNEFINHKGDSGFKMRGKWKGKINATKVWGCDFFFRLQLTIFLFHFFLRKKIFCSFNFLKNNHYKNPGNPGYI